MDDGRCSWCWKIHTHNKKIYEKKTTEKNHMKKMKVKVIILYTTATANTYTIACIYSLYSMCIQSIGKERWGRTTVYQQNTSHHWNLNSSIAHSKWKKSEEWKRDVEKKIQDKITGRIIITKKSIKKESKIFCEYECVYIEKKNCCIFFYLAFYLTNRRKHCCLSVCVLYFIGLWLKKGSKYLDFVAKTIEIRQICCIVQTYHSVYLLAKKLPILRRSTILRLKHLFAHKECPLSLVFLSLFLGLSLAQKSIHSTPISSNFEHFCAYMFHFFCIVQKYSQVSFIQMLLPFHLMVCYVIFFFSFFFLHCRYFCVLIEVKKCYRLTYECFKLHEKICEQK